MSWPTTLGDRPDLMRKLTVHPEDFDPACKHTQVIAPCCGRKAAADTIVSLHGLKTEIKGGNYLPKRDHDWACDGCLHLLILDQSNGWTRSKLFRALGAPAEVIRHQRAKEIEHEERLAANTRDSALISSGQPPVGFNPEQSYTRAHASLPADVRELAGTERPDV